MGQKLRKRLSKATGDSRPTGWNKDWTKALIKPCWDQGAEFKQTKSGWFVIPPGGGDPVLLHQTLSDHRSLENARALLREAGFDV